MLLLGRYTADLRDAVCCQKVLGNAADASAVCLEVEIVQYKAAQPQGNSRLTSAVNSKASSVPRQDKARLAVMRWVLRFLDPAAANTPDSNSSNPSTCAQHQWCVRNVCVSLVLPSGSLLLTVCCVALGRADVQVK